MKSTETEDKQPRQWTEQRKNRKLVILTAAGIVFLVTGSILYILYRTHPLVAVKDALQKTADAGCFSFTIRSGDETLSGTALVDVKQKKIDLAAEGKEKTIYIYQNTIFSVEKGTGAVSGYQDISDMIALVSEILEGKMDADAFVARLRRRLVLGSLLDYFFDGDLLAESVREYLGKVLRTDYLETYFGYRKRTENKNNLYSFTLKLYDAAEDFMETIRPAFWNEEKYRLFREKVIEERASVLQNTEFGIDFTIQNGYIINIEVRNGDRAADAAFGDFGKAEIRPEEAAPYYRKEKERRGWT